VIYAEFSVGYQRIEDVERLLAEADIGWAEIPRAALFLARKAFQLYHRQGESRIGVLPDFFYRGACGRFGHAAPDAGYRAPPSLFPDN